MRLEAGLAITSDEVMRPPRVTLGKTLDKAVSLLIKGHHQKSEKAPTGREKALPGHRPDRGLVSGTHKERLHSVQNAKTTNSIQKTGKELDKS